MFEFYIWENDPWSLNQSSRSRPAGGMEKLQESWLLTVEADCGLLCFSSWASAFFSSSSNLIWPTTREEKNLKDSAKYLQLLFFRCFWVWLGFQIACEIKFAWFFWLHLCWCTHCLTFRPQHHNDHIALLQKLWVNKDCFRK